MCARPQQHVGVVHSSNLCTEITLNTNGGEIAVCNLGSVNLAQHIKDGGIDHDKLKKTVRTAMRMLDNVIDINYYAVKKARDSNLRHRPVGLGIMGFQDALYQLRTPYASQAAVEFADRSMEAVCYQAYWASTELAQERGRYSSYRGSLWDRGILPIDSLKLLLEQRGGYVDVDATTTLDWDTLRGRIAEYGMRNSNCVAIAPTATISNIIGVDASIEPCFGNLSVKSNLSGEFTVINEYLVRDLKKPWACGDDVMVMDLKHFDGSLRRIDRVPEDIKALYSTAFEVEHRVADRGRRRAARSGSTRPSRSTSTWQAHRAKSSMKPTSWPGSVASRPPTTCAPSAPRTPRSRRCPVVSSMLCRATRVVASVPSLKWPRLCKQALRKTR